MKNLILLPLAVLSLSLLSAQAADTSGCSMKKTTQSKSTVLGKVVTVSNYKASEPGCWNAQDGKVVLAYQYTQEASETHKVIFWAKINGQEATINTNIACSNDGGLSYGANTSGVSYVNCTATAYIPTGYQETLNVEVAPQIDGAWDTYGFNQNYNFRF